MIGICTEYYSAIKDFDTAKDYAEVADNCLSSIHEGQSIFNYISDNLSKADILDHAGESKRAYALLRDVYEKNDSINSLNFSRQLAEIQTLYKVDKMKMEAQKEKAKLRITQLVLLVLLLTSLSLAYFVYFTRKNSRTLLEKNKQLYSQHTTLEQNKLAIKELKSLNTEKEEVSPHVRIMNKLEENLFTTEAYIKPDVSREELALAIGTNRQYLIEAIKAQTGQTFNEYIYSHRVKFAYTLIEANRSKNLSEVGTESGFLTRSTFNRAFKEVYGMNPGEFKELLKNNA